VQMQNIYYHLLSLFITCIGNVRGSNLPEKPNIIFIVGDDIGQGDLQCYGNPYIDTPIINSLAEQGVMLVNYYSPSPLCAPARAALLTGRYNHRTGAIDVSSNRGIDRIAQSEKTFGDYFKHAGYTTALIGKWHNGLYNKEYLPHNRGFDLFYGFGGSHDYWNWNLFRNDQVETSDGRYMTDVLNQEAVRFIRSNKNRPFALWLAHHAPHSYVQKGVFQAPPHLIEKYKPRVKGIYAEAVAVIYAMIEAMDTGLGWIIEELEKQELRENTIIVFVSDNGAHLKGSNYRYHGNLSGNKGEVLEQGIRVPAIVSWPGTIPGGRIEKAQVHGTDWLPTLYSLTGSNAPEEAKPLDGLNIMPLLIEGDMPELSSRLLFFQKNRYTPVAHSSGAIRKQEWKLRWPGESKSMAKQNTRDNYVFEIARFLPPWEMPIAPDIPNHKNIKTEAPQLFNLVEDPGEKNDLSAMHPEVVKELSGSYDAWFAEIYSEWEQSWKDIIDHDIAYWKDREIPDPRKLFDGYWPWDGAPAGTDPETADPLEVFKGYWRY